MCIKRPALAGQFNRGACRKRIVFRPFHFLSIASILFAYHPTLIAQALSNWTANTDPCQQSTELAKHDHMEIAVWMNSSNAALVIRFSHALDFWADILDMTWHIRNDSTCSIQIVDGDKSLFSSDVIAARSQFIDKKLFQGSIAFNPRCRMNTVDIYVTAIHEIGHVLGLRHNPNPNSVMYFLNPEYPPSLDKSDLASLVKHHKVRNRLGTLAARLHD